VRRSRILADSILENHNRYNSGDAVIFVCIGLVCTKTTGFLFVKIRRESRTRYEYFCEEEWESDAETYE